MITICTPRRQQEQQQQQKVKPGSTAIATLKWSSKFTIEKDLDENIDPFQEWSGSFALGEKPKSTPPLAMEDLPFHQLEGAFISNWDNEDAPTATDS